MVKDFLLYFGVLAGASCLVAIVTVLLLQLQPGWAQPFLYGSMALGVAVVTGWQGYCALRRVKRAWDEMWGRAFGRGE